MILPPGFKRLKNQRTAEPYFSEIKTEVSNDRIKKFIKILEKAPRGS